MKKIFLLLVFVVLGTTVLRAQDRIKAQDKIKAQDHVSLMLVDGDLLLIRDRDQIRLLDKTTLSDGAVVNADGTVLKRGGDKLRLHDGECIDLNGVIYANEYLYRSSVKQENKALTESQMQDRNKNRSHITLIDGNAYQVGNQVQNRVQEKLNLGNGTVVNPDGTYQTRNQKQMHLQEGECLNMEGNMFKSTYQQRKMVIQKNMNKNKNVIPGKTPVRRMNNIPKKGN
jgi:hypothetical protein